MVPIALHLIRFPQIMNWNKICIRPSFFLVISFAAYFGNPVILAWFLLAAALHEGGHLLAASFIGIPIRRLTLDFSGGNLAFYHKTTSYAQDLLLCLSGPAVNFLFVTLSVLFHWNPIFLSGHLLLGVFNLMPVLPLDGGRAVFAFLSGIWDPFVACRVMSLLSILVASALSLAGAWISFQPGGNPNLLILGLWMLISSLRSCNLRHFPIEL